MPVYNKSCASKCDAYCCVDVSLSHSAAVCADVALNCLKFLHVLLCQCHKDLAIE